MKKSLFYILFLTILVSEARAQGFCVVDAQRDTTICQAGAPVRLTATSGALSYLWTANGMNPITIQNPIVNPLFTTTYNLSSLVLSPTELITNGDFTSGNSGFTSSYIYSPLSHGEGYYFVTPTPYVWHNGFSACVDHTTGTGNIMTINGAGTPNTNVWIETINVLPNTDYAFSTWVVTLVSSAPAILQFSVNGVLLGSAFNAPSTTCVWQQFYQIWNSGNNSTAIIKIVNQNVTLSGNDFGLDDISFRQMCYANDSVTVTVSIPTAPTISNNSPICIGDSLKLFAQTVSGSTYQWIGPNGFTSNSQNPIIPITNGTEGGVYSATTTTSSGCVSVLSSINVNFYSQPFVDLGNIINFCHDSNLVLNAGNFPTYLWSTGSNNSSISVTTPGNYSVTVTDNNNCSASDNLNITYFPIPRIQISASLTSGCEPLNVQFDVSSFPTSSYYYWSFSDISNSILKNPLHNFINDGLYDVNLYVTDINGCSNDTTLYNFIHVHPLPDASFSTSPSVGIIGASTTFSSSYTIQPALWGWDFGDNVNESNNVPVENHSYEQIGTYTVIHTVSTEFNCISSTTKSFIVINLEIPNFFSPNGDNYNETFFIKGLELLSNCKLQIFNRWGKNIYESNNYSNDWNGSGCSDGVYYFILTYPDNIISPIKGSITIIH